MHKPNYQYHAMFHAGNFHGPSGEAQLTELLLPYSSADSGGWEVVSVVPIVRNGETAGVQIVARRAAT